MSSTDAPDAPESLYERMRVKADEVEAELKRIGYWQQEPPKPEAFQFKRAFAADTMAFPQWLQFVLLPRVRDIAADRKQVPDASNVGAYAIRELDGDPNADQLVTILSEFDSLFGTPQVYLPGDSPQRRRRATRTTLALAWTVLAIGLGVLFAGYAPKLAPKVRTEMYSFAVHEPESGGYEAIDLTASAEGRAGGVRPRELLLRMYPQRAPVPGGDMAVDLTADPSALTYRYREADGRERAGPLTADAVVAWMRRCGIEGDPARLNLEAAALVRFAQQVRQDPAGTYNQRRKAAGTAPAAEPYRLSAISNLERERPGTLPAWVRFGAPVVLWLAGLGVVALLRRG